MNVRSFCLLTGESEVREVEVMYAVIKTGGKQYRVSEGDMLKVEKLDCAEGEEITFDRVLAVSDDDSFDVGRPVLEDARVKAEVVEHGKNKKVEVFKFKPKKRYKKKTGHRQPFTRVKIDEIAR